MQERCLGWGFAKSLRLLSITWRSDVQGLEVLDELAASRQKHILAFWHRHYITMFRLIRNQSAIAITNQSHRGKVIASICQCNGIAVLQVHENESRQLLESLQNAEYDNLGLGITVDGPLGPPLEVKSVVLHLAAKLDWPIVPVAVASSWKHVFATRWDRLEIPHLFSRVAFTIGTPIYVAPTISRRELRDTAVQLKDAIERGTTLAQKRLRS